MASSRKRPSADLAAALSRSLDTRVLQGARIAVALSGGVDSVVLLHLLKQRCGLRLSAIHVHHGLSPNADAWARFCRRVCRAWKVPLRISKVTVRKSGKGLEAAAREARYEAFKQLKVDVIALAHHLDDQAQTVLMNLLRGAGARGASGMPARARLDGKWLLRPLLDAPREAIVAYARSHALPWVEDESNADEALTRNFVRRRLGPLIASRYPGWREALARAARHFSAADQEARLLVREFLASRGLRAPSEAKLVEMLKQLSSAGRRTLIEHDGMRLRVYRGKVALSRALPQREFTPVSWSGERRIPLPALGGELRFRAARGAGIDARTLGERPWSVRLRSGGERLQPDPRRPRRTLKNLFQETGVPAWERERLPLLYCGEDLVWVPGLGVDARYQAPARAAGWLPQFRRG